MIVLDTYVWIWWVSSPSMLSNDARKAIQTASDAGQVYVSSISVWEVALLVKRGRLELTMDVDAWLPRRPIAPLTSNVSISLVLPGQFSWDHAWWEIHHLRHPPLRPDRQSRLGVTQAEPPLDSKSMEESSHCYSRAHG